MNILTTIHNLYVSTVDKCRSFLKVRLLGISHLFTFGLLNVDPLFCDYGSTPAHSVLVNGDAEKV